MALQDQGASAGPAAARARVLTLTVRRFLVRALRLQAADGGLWSYMLSASPLGPRRPFLEVFSAEQVQAPGIRAPHQELAESHLKRHWLLLSFRFKFLLLLCLMVFILVCTLSSRATSWKESEPLYQHYQRFSTQNNLPLVTPNEIYETTERPTGPPTERPTGPPTERPTVPPTERPTGPPTERPAVPPTERPTGPPTERPTEHPTGPPTERPAVPPTERPAGTLFHHAYPRNYHFIMDNKDVCKTRTPFLVLMVPVAPANVAARNAIRQTWGNESLVQGEVVLTLFMLGLSGGSDAEERLKQENLKHHDLIQSDFMDTYLNLTTKTMVIMDWLATRCPTAAYAMKVDSDMFLNIDNLVIMLQKPGIPKVNYLTGMLMWNRPVLRSKSSKWYVPEDLYPDPRYPTYTLGMGYIFSNDLPEKFVEASKWIKPFNIEDAYIGMCMKKLGLAPASPPNPSQFKAYNTRYDRCEYSKVITYILGSAQQLVKYWRDLKKAGPPC